MTGLVAGNERDRGLLGNYSIGYANPTFASSSAANEAYAVYSGCAPFDGFHLGEVFGNITFPGLAADEDFRKLEIEWHFKAPPAHKMLYSNFVFVPRPHIATKIVATDWNACVN